MVGYRSFPYQTASLEDSSQAGTLDVAAKFNVPLSINGKVFVASQSRLTAYGTVTVSLKYGGMLLVK
jgi:hypothetical protein